MGAQFASEVTEAVPIVGERTVAKDTPLDAQEASLLRDLLRLIPEDRFAEACTSHGITAEEVVVRTKSIMSKIEPAEAVSVTPLGAHRPAGTLAAAATIAAEAKDMRLAMLESENVAIKAHMHEMGQVWADAGDEMASGAEASAQTSAKRKKLGDLVSAISKFGENTQQQTADILRCC